MSNVRQAVEKREQAAAPAQVSLATVVRQAIETQSAAFRQVLPKGVDPDRFSRLVLTAVKATPDLMRCFETTQGQTSVLLAAMQAAALGIEPNTPTQDCWLLPRKNQGVWEAQLSIGYRGYLRLARRSGMVKTIYAEVVREGDDFTWSRGLEADVLEHTPAVGQRGELEFAYSVARYTDGGYSFIVLDRTQVEARRDMSDSWRNERARPYSPWKKWPESMWRKSAIRALVPYLDLSADFQRATTVDEARLSFDDEAGVIEVAEAFGELATPDDMPEAPEAPEGVDAETGEVS
jgi:recombination protein RecT